MKHEQSGRPSPDGPFPSGEAGDLTISGLLSAISETEYPQYILDALDCVQGWMNETISGPWEQGVDPFSAMFEGENEEGIEGLFERLESLEEYVDLIPNTRRPKGRPDVIIVSIAPPDYESGLRTAIDYAAVFNRPNCRRVWIITDTFIFDDVVRYAAHVDALAGQGVVLRFLLVTPWGWVELPLSGATASKRQFVWSAPSPSFPTSQQEDRRKGGMGRKSNL